MRFLCVLCILLILPLTAYSAEQGGGGAAKAAICSACHGVEGKAINDLYPNLAGQNGPYIEKQLRAFRSGERKDPIMAPMATALTDTEIQTLATYYSKMN